MIESSSELLRRPGPWAWCGALFLYFAGLAFATAPVEHALLDVVSLAVLYALLTLTLHFGVLFLAGLGALPRIFAALGLALVTVWHFRESLLVPAAKPSFAAVCVVVALPAFLVLRSLVRDARPLGVLPLALGSALLCVAAVAGTFLGSNELRWKMLHFHRLFGTPAYYLLSRPTDDHYRRLWEAGRRTQPAPAANAFRPATPTTLKGAPNIVFVLVDTLRADALAAYGSEGGLTPRLDRLADRAVVFDNVRANASWTKASVASFFTGLLPEEHGAVDRGHRLSAERLTLAEVLADSGYRTAAFVTNFANVGRATGFDQGFQEFFELEADGLPYARAGQVNATVGGWLSDLRRRTRAAPFRPTFLYVHYLDPHAPYLSGVSDSVFYDEARRAYDSELRYLDEHLARLVEVLGRELAPAFVLITSDHGEEFGEHGSRDHGHTLYRELVRLPALLITPDGDRGRIDARLEARDFFDLLVELSRAPDLEPAAWAASREREVRYSAQYVTREAGVQRPALATTCKRAVERDGTVLIWSGFGPTLELYDHTIDPEERVNLARSRPETVAELRESMQDQVRFWSEPTEAERDERDLDLLRRLGYVE